MKAKKAIQQKMQRENSRGNGKPMLRGIIYNKLSFFDSFVTERLG